jgi:hypothetical protein
MISKRSILLCLLAIGAASLFSLTSVEARRSTAVTAPAENLHLVTVSPS